MDATAATTAEEQPSMEEALPGGAKDQAMKAPRKMEALRKMDEAKHRSEGARSAMTSSKSMENVGAKFYELTVEERRKKYSMSARNSSYWLKVVARSHSDLSLQATAPIESPPVETLRSSSWKTVESQDTIDEPSCTSVDEAVFEHQRYQLVLGWGSKGCLLPLDPKKYATASYEAQFPVFPTIPLPSEGSDEGCGRWEWVTPWQIHVHADTDNDGWRYSTSFSHLRLESTACFGYHRKTTFCRRRKWVRRRLFVPLHSPSMLQPCGMDGVLLERKCGWLHKLGHRRKNWKHRFFVLDGSVLQYYTDDVSKAKTPKLKGEVLLFHKDTTVHYADEPATGRAFCFAIDAGAYSLLLQAPSELDREAWIYAIEDAILCRDSYCALDDQAADDRRSEVMRRRSLSATSVTASMGGVQDDDMHALYDAIVGLYHDATSHFVKKYKFHFQTTSKTEAVETKVVRALKSYRMFVERTLAKVLDRFCEHMKRQGNKDDAIEAVYYSAREASLRCIERVTFLPLHDLLYSMLQLSLAGGDAALAEFESRRRWLAEKPQSFFDIRPAHISPSNWGACTDKLNALDEHVLPSEKGLALVEAAKSIYAVFHAEHTSVNVEHLAADDFLPIFIYVLCQSSLTELPLTRRVLSETTISSIMIGEIGYYTTMLEAAVEFVCSYHG
ncbi:hypothetical protein SDRG_14286 [Saprolegnia diclina VS20]|uniref:VPS9 domain-containing protein n=1 Tax=Saprolegnia diclina (strain VS20) TaxID=1156394 RepID=T0PRB0_SAPDV|nr:hypothetical protein SDRG_14286 [Saprolegnia diclina VS20]EQC28014.1 hypothetical protein SDRG_14286 [Saprolegnia diclina VS20]|eukprot:XP_008618627.1 hypothetical protein SDRG_14286 [Saprolegnia diclina VS20]